MESKLKFKKAMAFNDLPKVDRNSINSDKSVIALQQILNQSAGFILRTDVPDFGCDFDVELISESKSAMNTRFPLQLKSIENITLTKENKFISYQFKTSRLGYLLRRLPAYGIIVIYDVKNKLLYYDYADEIYLRLVEERENEEWKNNEHVNILIPIDNVLDNKSAELLHKKFMFRFNQGERMQLSHGVKYGLPSINFQKKEGYDFNNLEDIKGALNESGMALLFHFDLQIVYTLISQIPVAQIVLDKKLCIIALITYAEAGKYAESIYYIERIRKRFELTEEDSQIIDFVEIKNKLGLGDLSPSEYIEKGKKMLPDLSGSNLIVLKINMLFFQLSAIRFLEEMPLGFGDEIQNLFVEIEESANNDIQKEYLKLWNGENLLLWIAHFRNESFGELQLRNAMNSPLPLEVRVEKVKSLSQIHGMFYNFLDSIDKKALEWKNDLLRAHLINLNLKFEISFQISQITNRVEIPEKQNDLFLNKMELSMYAFKIFLENNHFLNAYLSLLYHIELLYISRQRYNLIDKYDLEDLLKTKSEMEREFEFDGEIHLPRILDRRNKMDKENNSSMSFLVGLNNSQLDSLAELVMQTKNFPNAKKEFIIGEMKSYQLFYERCTNKDVTIEQSIMNDHIAYSQPVSFILKNQKTNFVSVPNTNMDNLLKSWGY